MSLLQAAARLRDAIQPHTHPIGTATHVLNPLTYAWAAHEQFVQRYGPTSAEAIWVGMNPGPWGMMQTGVPFGSIPAVRDYLKIDAPIEPVTDAHPKRQVMGFDCPREEVSGKRLWGTIEAEMGPPERFFERYWIVNYCPLIWQAESGANLPPDKLPKDETRELFAACDAHLVEVIRLLRPRTVIGVGAWTEKLAKRLVKAHELPVRVGRVLHPSPASPAANRGWAAAATRQLEALGHPLRPL